MGRLVRIPQKRAIDAPVGGFYNRNAAAEPQRASRDEDDYLMRLAKYVPAEVLAFSVFINALLDQAIRTGGAGATMAGIPVTTIALGALIAGTLLSPFFVWYVHGERDAWITNACVSCIAFPFWSYALGAVAFSGFRDGNLAAILLASFTVLSGLIKPPLPRGQKAEQAREPLREGPRLVENTFNSSGS